MKRAFYYAVVTSLILAFLASGCGDSRVEMVPPHPFLGFVAPKGTLEGERILLHIEEIGAMPAMMGFSLQWPDPTKIATGTEEFPLASFDSIWNLGSIPMLTWKPKYFDDSGKEVAVPLKSITEGDYDEYLRFFANSVKEWGYPLMIRPAPKMNLKKNHWGTTPEEFGPDSPEAYKKLFRHLVEFFRKEGANNAVWVFSPAAESDPSPHIEESAIWNVASAYYPGDAWVDIIGMSGFNWGRSKTGESDGRKTEWRSFRQIFGPLHKEMSLLAPKKPFMVCEVASANAGGDRPSWIKESVDAMKEMKLVGAFWYQFLDEADWPMTIEEGQSGWINPPRRSTMYSESQLWIMNLVKLR